MFKGTVFNMFLSLKGLIMYLYNINYIENIKQYRTNRMLLINSKKFSEGVSSVYRIRECLEKVRKEDRW